MKAIQVTQNGGAEVLTLREVEKPKPGPTEALVRLENAGLNFIDIYQRRGEYKVPLPFIPGLEGSGVVEAVGTSVKDVRPGDRVAYTGAIGSYSEFNLVEAERLIPLPNEVSFEQGAAFPLQGMTAHYLLNEFYVPQRGDTVLVHAAAGGMGLLLVQWLKHMGTRVLGTVSNDEKAKMARTAGADEVILYSKTDFVAEAKRLTEGRGVDYIIDGVGKTTFRGNLDAVKRRGHVAIFGSASGPAEPIAPNMLQQKSIAVWGGSLFNYLDTRKELLTRATAVLDGIRQGWLKLNIERVIPLAQTAEAHALLEGRKTTGKVLLKIRG